jgi:hypothetical protein
MTEQKQKTTNYRISAAPVIGADGDVYAIPGDTPGAGAAQPILPYIRSTYNVSTANVVGILISCPPGGAGTQHVHVRTSTIGLDAGETGKGIAITAVLLLLQGNHSTFLNQRTIGLLNHQQSFTSHYFTRS